MTGVLFGKNKNSFTQDAIAGRSKLVAFKNAGFLIDSRYRIKSILGKGSYGTVCSAIDTKASVDGEEFQVAIKKVCNIFGREVLLKRALRELKLMRHFKGHKNVIRHHT